MELFQIYEGENRGLALLSQLPSPEFKFWFSDFNVQKLKQLALLV